MNRQTSERPYFSGLLEDTQAQALARIQAGLIQAHKAIQHINGLIVDNKLPLRTINAYEIGTVYGASEQMAFTHEMAEKQLRRSCNAPERVSA